MAEICREVLPAGLVNIVHGTGLPTGDALGPTLIEPHPSWMTRMASPMALEALAQAVATAAFPELSSSAGNADAFGATLRRAPQPISGHMRKASFAASGDFWPQP